MSSSLLNVQELTGLFELDSAGKVLYYRTDSGEEPDGGLLEMAGQNFYDEVAAFDNVEEFRQCVNEFTRGPMAADSFAFDCHYDGYAYPVRVLLARICERADRKNTKSILVHIRCEENTHEKFRGERDERDVD